MKCHKLLTLITVLTLLSCLAGCTGDGKWEGQAPVQAVPTSTLPIQKQFVGVFDIGKGVFATNNFEGARLNGIAWTAENEISALITPENTPINPSPWYSFKIWSESKTSVQLKLTYLDGAFHRYRPKLSYDGENWKEVDEDKVQRGESVAPDSPRDLPEYVTMTLDLGPDTLWVSAQELQTSTHNARWINGLDSLIYVNQSIIGESREGRPIRLMRIGNTNDSKMIFVLSRQHPPEVTGYLAMKSFVETICSDLPVAENFRDEYTAYIVPMANPDGVDNGHWRHNHGGRDLNRDWGNQNQQEVAAIQNFIENKLDSSGGKFYFGVDFHSTWEDIYYTIEPELKGNFPGLVPDMITSMADELGLDPNIRPGRLDTTVVTSSSYMFHRLNAESLTYELGDDTPRDLLKDKGRVSALKLMELLLAGPSE